MLFSIYGSDNYRIDEKLKEMKDSFILKRDKSGLNVVNLDGEKIDLGAFQQEVMATPFLSEKKMVIVKNIFKNKKAHKELTEFLKTKKDNIDNVVGFVDYLEPKKKLTGPLFKLLGKEKFKWEFNEMNSGQLSGWLRKHLADKKIEIEAPAINELVIRVGNDLNAMTLEIDKLSAYKNKGAITTDDVKLLVNAKFDDNIFTLVDAIGQQNKKLALKLISDQLNSGSHELAILKMIQRQFKILLQVKEGGQAVGLHPFVVQKAASQSRNFTLEKLTNIYDQLLRIESKLKNTGKNPELLFDLFIAQNC